MFWVSINRKNIELVYHVGVLYHLKHFHKISIQAKLIYLTDTRDTDIFSITWYIDPTGIKTKQKSSYTCTLPT